MVPLGRSISILVALATLSDVVAQSPEDYLQQAASMVARHEMDEARDILQQGLQTFPRHPDVLIQLGLLLIMTENLEAGDRLLSEALVVRPFDRRAIKGKAEAQLRKGSLEEAARLFESALSQRSTDAEARYRLAFVRFAQERDQEALAQARHAVERSPLNVAYRRLYALFLRFQGHKEESTEQLRIALQLAPSDISTLIVVSQDEWQQGNRERAIELAERAARLDPENPLRHRTLSRFYSQVGRNEEAAVRERLWLVHRKAFEFYLEALRAANQESLDQASELLHQALDLAPGFTTARLYLATLYSREGHDEKALELYSEILRQDPTQAVAVSQTAQIRLSQGSVDLALSTLEKGKARGENVELLKGYQAMQNQEYGAALTLFEGVRNDNPLLPGLLQLIAFCLNQVGEHEEALAKLATAAQVAPGLREIEAQVAQVHFKQAWGLQGQGRWKEAIQGYRSLVETHGPKPDFLFNLAYCYQQLGQLEKAVPNYRAGLRKKPSVEWARLNLASVLYLQQEYGDAAAELETVLSHHPSAGAYRRYGLCLTHLARHPEAELAFEKAQALGDESPELLYNLGACRLRLKKKEEAWPLLSRAARAGYDPAVRLIEQARRRR